MHDVSGADSNPVFRQIFVFIPTGYRRFLILMAMAANENGYPEYSLSHFKNREARQVINEWRKLNRG
jgi:hypothetical protein